jgi:hypothetical protein
VSDTTCNECGAEIDESLDRDGVRTPCPKCGSSARKMLMRAGPGQLTNYSLDHFVAHRLSELTECGAPELQQNPLRLNDFILNSIFRVKIEQTLRAYLFNFLRRADAAGIAYGTARTALIEYINTPRATISPYFTALAQFEVCISQVYQGHELFATATKQQVFKKGANSPEERLNVLYNDSKHMNKMIFGGLLPEPATTGIWITNGGLESSRTRVSFVELHAVLVEMYGAAEVLSKLEPGTPKAE